MITFFEVIAGLVAATVVISFAWRFASRRHTIPCPVWLRWMVELDNPFTKTNRAAAIVENSELREGMTVLDIGCGPGRVSIPAARKVGPSGRVFSIDLQPGMLQRVQKKVRAVGLSNVQTLQAKLGDGSLNVPPVDRALLVTVLGEIPDGAGALKEIFGVLKPGGILSITEFVGDPHFQSRGTVNRLAAAAGFRERQFFGHRLAYTLILERPATAG